MACLARTQRISGSNLAARRSYYACPSRILSQLPPFQSRYRHSGESPRFPGSRHLCDGAGGRSNASPPTHSSCARPERRSRPEAAPRGRQLRLVRAWHPNDGRGRGSRARLHAAGIAPCSLSRRSDRLASRRPPLTSAQHCRSAARRACSPDRQMLVDPCPPPRKQKPEPPSSFPFPTILSILSSDISRCIARLCSAIAAASATIIAGRGLCGSRHGPGRHYRVIR